MEEYVALDSNKQKKFVKGIKKLMKKTGAIPDNQDKPIKQKKPTKHGKVTKKKRKVRGLVYLSHIPHGFYEHQMTEYFKQFGMVTNVRVIRSKRTGQSKGHAFVEFKDIAVAQIVAETMNNYLMGKRLIKAVYIPPKDQRLKARRKNWNLQNNPGSKIKLNMKKAYNAVKNENEDLKIARKLLSNLTNTKSKLKELGIDYDFFTPVDVPEGLTDKVAVNEERSEDIKEDIELKAKKKKNNVDLKKGSKILNDDNVEESSDLKHEDKDKLITEIKKQMKLKKNSNKLVSSRFTKKEKESVSENKDIVRNKKNEKGVVVKPEEKKSEQEKKQQKMNEAGIKPPEEFISIMERDDESDDSHYEFDSDEYENMMNSDDSDLNASSDDEDDNEISQEELLDTNDKLVSKEVPEKKNNAEKKSKMVIQTIPSKKEAKLEKKKQKKRKASEKVVMQSKKPKFEKQNNKKLPKKQIKMRK